MLYRRGFFSIVAIPFLAVFLATTGSSGLQPARKSAGVVPGFRETVTVRSAVARDVSPPLTALALVRAGNQSIGDDQAIRSVTPEVHPAPFDSASVEQTKPGSEPTAEIVARFDGLGEGFHGPQGTARLRNPSDNSLAVGPDHIVQIVNTRMAVFTKKGARFDTTGTVLYGPVSTGNVFKGFGDFGDLNGGDAVVRYDQLADRWLIVLPIFRRLPFKKNHLPGKSGGPVQLSLPGVEGQPGAAQPLYQPTSAEQAAAPRRGPGQRLKEGEGSFAMCYTVSTSSDPLGSYYRYIFERPLFPDYPRPAVWPDGYYVPTSTGDDVVQKQAYVVDRAKMLQGEAATEQGLIIDGVNFLNNADLEGKQLPPPGAPNIMMAAGGTQLQKIVEDDGIYIWRFHVDWTDPAKTKLEGPTKIRVAPYHYLGEGQLTKCVPPDREPRVDCGSPLGEDSRGRRRHSLVRVPAGSGSHCEALPAGDLCAGPILPLDAQSNYRRQRQHRHRLLIRRNASLPRPAFRGQASRRPSGRPDVTRSGPRRRRSLADVHPPVAGLFADGD